MARRNYTMGIGKYYFQIKSGQQNIIMNRDTKQAAVDAYLKYKKIGKNAEWLGRWEGKKYSDKGTPSATTKTN